MGKHHGQIKKTGIEKVNYGPTYIHFTEECLEDYDSNN